MTSDNICLVEWREKGLDLSSFIQFEKSHNILHDRPKPSKLNIDPLMRTTEDKSLRKKEIILALLAMLCASVNLYRPHISGVLS